MSKFEQEPAINPQPKKQPETKEQRGYRISKEVLEIFKEARTEAGNAPTPKKPGLDYYDNKRETKKDGADTHHEGRYGKFEDDDE